MNLDLPSHQREELEAKVTALLLGELNAEESATVRKLIDVDDGLRKWHDQLKLTLGFVGEAAAESAKQVPLKLDASRREKLLAQFKTIQLKQPASKRQEISRWVALAAVVAAVCALAALCLPALSSAKKTPPMMFSFSAESPRAEYDAKRAPIPARPQPSTAGSMAFKESSQHAQVIVALPPGSDATMELMPPVAQPQESEKSKDTSSFVQDNVNGDLDVTFDSGVGGKLPSPSDAPLSGNRNSFTRDNSYDWQNKSGLPSAPLPVGAPLVAMAEPAPAAPPSQKESEEEKFQREQAPTTLGISRLAKAENQPTAISGMPSSDYAPPSGESSSGSFFRATTETAKNSSETFSTPGFALTKRINGTFNPSVTNAVIAGERIDNSGKLADKETVIHPKLAETFNDGKIDRHLNYSASNATLNYALASDIGDALKTLGAPVPIDDKKELRKSRLAIDDLDKGAIQKLAPIVPQPEVSTRDTNFSTFSLNVSDVSFKLAAASLQNGEMPDAGSIRSEEFINAFDYRDPEPAAGAPIGFAWERAGDPFAHNRDFLRFSIKTAAQGRDGRPLNLVLVLDKSGSMERADRVEIVRQALRVLASQLTERDTLSVVIFARTARLWVDGAPGNKAGEVGDGLSGITPEGGTNLEEAMKLGYKTALRHYLANGENRVVLLTDGAANLGNVDAESLKKSAESNRKQGIALDCFGIGWDGYNDDMLETLSRNGGGRYGFINTPEEAGTEFAGKLAGALHVAACDVKVQVEFNTNRVNTFRQIGYAKHQLAKEQFRDNSVKAAQIGAAESGNALYTIEINPAGDGPVCTVRVRFRTPGTSDYLEREWVVPYTGTSASLDKAAPAMRLSAVSAGFSEWLAGNPYAGEATPDQLLNYLTGVPGVYGVDTRPQKLESMIRQAKSITGK